MELREQGMREAQGTGASGFGKSAVLTGMYNPMFLSVARSLGRRGITVIGVDADTPEFYSRSRYLSKTVLCRESLFGESLIETLVELGRTFDEKAVLLNMTDQSALNVSEHREVLEPWYDFVLPSHPAFLRFMNKVDMYRLTIERGLPVPATSFTSGREDLESLAPEIEYPCIVKPDFRDEEWNVRLHSKVLDVSCEEELRRYMRDYDIGRWQLVLQARVPGGDSDLCYCLCYLDRGGRPLAASAARKLLQHPAGAGTTSVGETLFDDRLVELTLEVLETGECAGFCSAEFKYDREQDRYWLIEPTIGRPDTQLELAVASGVDLPWISYRDAAGLPPDGGLATNARSFRWFNEPLYSRNIKDSLGSGGKGLAAILFLLGGGPKHFDLFHPGDSLPFLHFLLFALAWPWRKLRSLAEKMRGAVDRPRGRDGGNS